MKKFHYRYWTCIPALIFPDQLCQLSTPRRCTNIDLLQQCVIYTQQQKYAFIVLQLDNGTYQTVPLHRLCDQQSSDRCTLVFTDPSTEPLHPGWPLRNLLAAIAYRRLVGVNLLTNISYLEVNGIEFELFVYASHLLMDIVMRVQV